MVLVLGAITPNFFATPAEAVGHASALPVRFRTGVGGAGLSSRHRAGRRAACAACWWSARPTGAARTGRAAGQRRQHQRPRCRRRRARCPPIVVALASWMHRTPTATAPIAATQQRPGVARCEDPAEPRAGTRARTPGHGTPADRESSRPGQDRESGGQAREQQVLEDRVLGAGPATSSFQVAFASPPRMTRNRPRAQAAAPSEGRRARAPG